MMYREATPTLFDNPKYCPLADPRRGRAAQTALFANG
jgi:hypothetical protein